MIHSGQRRSAWARLAPTILASSAPWLHARGTASGPVSDASDSDSTLEVGLAYAGHGAIIVRGAYTRRTYAFVGHAPALAVDARDVPALLATRFFVVGREEVA